MILLYPEPYLSYFWCRIKRNRTNIMKTTIKYICTGLSLCACTCLVNNLPAQAETTNTAAVSATETDWDRQSIMEVARRVADWQIKDYPENKYAKSEPRGWIAGALYMGMFDWAELSGDNTYYDWLRKIFNRQSWQVANRHDTSDWRPASSGRSPIGCIMPTTFVSHRPISISIIRRRMRIC